MEYAVLFMPMILSCLALGFGFGISTLFFGAAPFIVLAFFETKHSILFSAGLFVAAGFLCFFSKAKQSVDWKEVFRLGLFFVLGVGAAFYFSFPFYFRYSASFLFVSGLVWLLALPFVPHTVPHRQFTFYPFFSNLVHGLSCGLVVGALGFAGFPLLVPFLQIFRKVDRAGAVSTSIPMGALALGAIVLVLNTPKAAPGPLFADPSFNQTYYLMVAGLFFVGMVFGTSFGKGLLKSISPFVVSVAQIFLILGTIVTGWKMGKVSLPCLSQNPLSCLSCLKSQSPVLSWSSFIEEDNPFLEVVINGCGQPLGLEQKSSTRTDLVVRLPSSELNVGLNRKTGLYSDSWEGIRIKRVRKQRIYFDKAGCSGKAALSRRKLETQVGISSIVSEIETMVRDVSGTRSAFWYASYWSESGECVNSSGVIKSSTDIGVYDLSLPFHNAQWGEPVLDEACCHKFSLKDTFISTLYYTDEDCQSTSVATDDEGPAGVGKSVLYHQDKYYLINGKKASFEYRSYRPSGKDCVKQEGLLSPLAERQAFSIEEISRPHDFSTHLPLSSRGIGVRDLRFWGIK